MSSGNSGDFDRYNPSAAGNAFGANANPPEPKKNTVLYWVLGILGIVTVVGALVCCGGGFLLYRVGTQAIAGAISTAVAEDPKIVEHIGTIQSSTTNVSASNKEKLVFDIVGDKGSGQLEVSIEDVSGDNSPQKCVLVLPSGERHEIVMNLPDEEFTEIDVSEGEAAAPDLSDPAETADPTITPELAPN